MVTVTGLPSGSEGTVKTAGGATVTNGMTLTPAELTALTFTPTANYSGSVSDFTYTVTEPGQGGLSTSAKATFTITPVNDLPVAVADSGSTTQGKAVTLAAPVTGNDTDSDGSIVVTTVDLDPATAGVQATRTVTGEGTYAVNAAGILTFTPDASFAGTSTINYVVADDGGGISNPAAITITVLALAVATDDSYGVTGGTTLTISTTAIGLVGNDTVGTGNTATVAIITATAPTAAEGVLTLAADGTFTFVPTAGFSGPVTFDYTLTSSNGQTDTATVTINVNAPPVAVNDAATTLQGTTVVFATALTANDSDSDGTLVLATIDLDPTTVGVQITKTVANQGTFSVNAAGIVTFVPVAAFVGTAAIPYVVADDDGGLSNQATITVTVRAPIGATDDGYTVDAGETLTVPANGVLGNDTLGAGVTATIALVTGTGPDPLTEGTLTLNPDGSFAFTPVAGFSGTVTFDYELTSSSGLEDEATVTIDVNGPPVAVDDITTTNEDSPKTIAVLGNDSDPDGDDLDVTDVLVAPAHGTATIESDGTITYVPAPGYSGPDSFTYEVCDAAGLCDSATVTLTVNPVNDAPVGGDDIVTTPEDTGVLIAVLENDGDPEGDPVHVGDIADEPSHGTVEVLEDGTLLYLPDPGFVGDDTFVYALCDDSDACVPVNVLVHVTPVDDAPAAADDSATTTPGAAVKVAVLTNDSDPDGDLLTVGAILIQPAHGDVSVGQDGRITYTPDAGFSGEDNFVYTACDPAGHCDAASVAITVGDDNAGPLAGPDVESTERGTAVVIDVTDNDSDPDEDVLVPGALGQPTHGETAWVGGEIRYTPEPGFVGEDRFWYEVCDASICTSALVTVTVNPGANTTPVALDDLTSTPRNTPIAIAVLPNDVDPEGDTLSVTTVGDPAHGTASIGADGRVTYTPDAGFVGTDSFDVVISDGHGGTATSTTTVVVTPAANRPPLADDDSYQVVDGAPLELDVLVNDSDPDSDPLAIVAVVQPAHGSVTIAPDGTLTYTPYNGYVGPDAFTYTITDGRGGFSEALVELEVTSDNSAPALTDDRATTPEDTAVLVVVLANDGDPDGDALDVTRIVTQPLHGTVTVNPDNTVLYTPAPDFNGEDSFSYEACDPSGACATANVAIVVAPQNDAPEANDDAALTPVGTPVEIPVASNDGDPDGDDLSDPEIVVQPVHGDVTVADDGTVTYTPEPDFRGVDTFTYEVCDAAGACDQAVVTIDVGSDNAPPVANDDTADVPAGGLVVIPAIANDTDPDRDPLTITAVENPAHGTVSIGPNGITYVADPGFSGTDSFFYTVCDGANGCDTAIITVTVGEAPNAAPVAVDDVTSTPKNTPVAIDVLANDQDPDGGVLAVLATGPAAHGVVSIGPDGTVTYTPAADFVGPDSFEVTIIDEDGATATSTVFVNVTPAQNGPPVATDDRYDATGAALVLAVLGNDSDPDGDSLVVVDIAQPAHGSVTVGPDGKLVYTPDAGYDGDDSFIYTVSDGFGGFDEAVVTIVGVVHNLPPVAADDVATTGQDHSVLIVVLANDSDPDGDSIIVAAIAAEPKHGTVVINDDQTVLYTPTPGFVGTDSFTYRTCDPSGACSTRSWSFTSRRSTTGRSANPTAAPRRSGPRWSSTWSPTIRIRKASR